MRVDDSSSVLHFLSINGKPQILLETNSIVLFLSSASRSRAFAQLYPPTAPWRILLFCKLGPILFQTRQSTFYPTFRGKYYSSFTFFWSS